MAQIVKLLQSPRKRVRWKQKCHNKIWGKDLRKRNVLSCWRKVGNEGMTECPVARNSRGQMLLRLCVYAWLLCTSYHYWSSWSGLHWRGGSCVTALHSSVVCICCQYRTFLAICYRPSVCLSSVMLVHPTQAVQIFSNISTAFGTSAIRWHPRKILRRSPQGNPSVGGVKHKRGS